MHVEEDQIGPLRRNLDECLGARRHNFDRETIQLEAHLIHLADVSFIFD